MKQTRGNHRHHAGALCTGAGSEHRFQSDASQGSNDSGDMAVGQGTANTKARLVGGDELHAAQAGPDQLDGLGGQVREVAEGFVADLTAFAKGAA